MHLPAPASQHSFVDSSTILYARVAVVQPGRCGDRIVDSVENERYLGGPTRLLAGRLSVPGASSAAVAKVLIDSE